ncbi:L-ascorbate metabolism protein UlaG (beta-lactamase superfamily) [Kitasatospora gansuensis]|uniref:L-ascorbate metabolism protein UlaG (Beta-lactamase superfamily) n=1 Tax=Kitasatospora gansuensis TaxID=258050 RepID=A0A7W7SH97_9ACTN|nr:MBL fold metallo-hydrolase [Kitasatospora gansuensis]MBB4950425.1 L-ascorbate metabolism protein UlaG (beta-lactamase superfamily) [Kitasatospora gansuensis]
MRLIKYGHACVRLETDGRVLVIDPGTYSEAEALDSASDVLVTHEHPDHIDIAKLVAAREQNPELRVYLPRHAAEQLPELGDSAVVVEVGQRFTAAGFTVDVVGGAHAEIYDGLPGCANVGFVVDGDVYHPGDSLFVPEQSVTTLLVPAGAPWLKLAEALDFVRAVKPVRAFPIHDAYLSDLGRENFDGWMDFKGDTEYARIPLGESVTF